MKRIITFFLIILVLIFIGLIVINKLERNKVKEDFYFPKWVKLLKLSSKNSLKFFYHFSLF